MGFELSSNQLSSPHSKAVSLLCHPHGEPSPLGAKEGGELRVWQLSNTEGHYNHSRPRLPQTSVAAGTQMLWWEGGVYTLPFPPAKLKPRGD